MAPYIGTAVHAQFEQLFPTLNPQGFDDKKEGKRFETENASPWATSTACTADTT
jgi:hypothetical protein